MHEKAELFVYCYCNPAVEHYVLCCGVQLPRYALLRFFLLFRLALELLYVLLWHTLFIRSPNKRLYTKAEAPPERMEPDFMSPNE